MKRCVLLTSMPSPYMVELIDAVNGGGRWHVLPLYESYSSRGRAWRKPELRHDNIFLSEDNRLDEVAKAISECDLVVTGKLWGKSVRFVLNRRRVFNKPLVLWAERPGATKRNLLANAVRGFAIWNRFRHANAVWGIGNWAVEEYKKSLPGVKQFDNMPYASNLFPYLNIERHCREKGHELRFLFSGSLIMRKGIDLLVDAFTLVLDEGYKARLTIMGQGDMRSALEARTKGKHAGRIEFIGFKDWQELPTVYAQHDVLVAPSRYDGWGLIVVEGLAAGMPVIATDMMGAAHDFLNRENGWIIPAGKGEHLYIALREAVSTDLEEKRAAARKSIECWKLDMAAKRWCDLADAAVESADD